MRTETETKATETKATETETKATETPETVNGDVAVAMLKTAYTAPVAQLTVSVKRLSAKCESISLARLCALAAPPKAPKAS